MFDFDFKYQICINSYESDEIPGLTCSGFNLFLFFVNRRPDKSKTFRCYEFPHNSPMSLIL